MLSEPHAGIEILVVDDNADLCRSLEVMLAREGFRVSSALNGERALQAQAKHPAQVLITDLLMPEKDGIETITQFRRQYPAVKIIAMSGGGVRVHGERYLFTASVLGADAVLKKPFEKESLLATLRQVMASPQPGSP